MKIPKLKQHMIVEFSNGNIGMIFKVGVLKIVVYDNGEGWDFISSRLSDIIVVRKPIYAVDFCFHGDTPVIWRKVYNI